MTEMHTFVELFGVDMELLGLELLQLGLKLTGIYSYVTIKIKP